MKIVRSDPDGERTIKFLKVQMEKYNLDDELLEALAELIDRGAGNAVAIEASVRDFIKNDDALSTSGLLIFKHGGEVNGERAIPFIELSPAIMKVLSHMRDILEMGLEDKKDVTKENGRKS